jgi:hypothetical protein
MTMKRIAILAGLALALILVAAVEVAAADCIATNCAIDAQHATPAQTSSTNAESGRTPGDQGV